MRTPFPFLARPEDNGSLAGVHLHLSGLRALGVSVSGCARWLPQDTDRWAPPVGSFSYLQPERWRWTPARLPLSSGQARNGNGFLVPPPTCSWSGRHRRWSGSPATR